MSLRFYQPLELTEAVDLLTSSPGVGKLLAGGTDLVLQMREGKVKPDFVVDLSKIQELRFIKSEAGLIRIGTMATFTDLHTSPLLRERVTCLAEAAGLVGSPQIRNQGTVGGNIANASPAADSVPALVALGAVVKITGGAGTREAKLSDILVGAGKNNLAPDEIITEVSFSEPNPVAVSAFVKLGRRKALAISRISVAVLVALDSPGERVIEARIGLGSVAPNPFRVTTAEAALLHRGLTPEGMEEAVEAVCAEASVTLSNRASAAYKKAAVRGVAREALARVYRNLTEGGRQHA